MLVQRGTMTVVAFAIGVAALVSAGATGGLAHAGTLEVTSVAGNPVVLLDGHALGQTPVTVADVLPGDHELAFQPSHFEPVEFGQRIEMPERGGLQVVVDFDTHAVIVDTLAPEPAQVPPPLPSQLAPERRSRAPRLVLNSAVTAAGAGLGVLAGLSYARARSNYEDYLNHPNDAVADRIYEKEVRPRRTAFYVEGAGALLLLGGGVTLWATTDWTAITVGPGRLQLSFAW